MRRMRRHPIAAHACARVFPFRKRNNPKTSTHFCLRMSCWASLGPRARRWHTYSFASRAHRAQRRARRCDQCIDRTAMIGLNAVWLQTTGGHREHELEAHAGARVLMHLWAEYKTRTAKSNTHRLGIRPSKASLVLYQG